MYFPDDIFKHIISYCTTKKRFKINPNTLNTDLHYLIQRIGMNNIPLSPPPRLLLEYLNEYCLTENNYLQNKYGNTPLHIAAQYNIFYQIYKLCKPIVPKMAYVTNNIGKIPAETKSKLHFWSANC